LIVADTSALLAFFNASEPAHEAVVDVLSGASTELAISPYVLAELDYLVSTRIGTAAELAMLEELSSGAYELAAFDGPDLLRARAVVERYSDQQIGLADASLVVLAQRYATRTILTLDHRHFTVLRPLTGGRFTLLP